MLDIIWILCTFITYGFEFGVIALIFVGITTKKGRDILRKCIGL